jgi:hypothetical protein
LRTWKFWQILLILLNISVLITGHVEHDIRKWMCPNINSNLLIKMSYIKSIKRIGENKC